MSLSSFLTTVEHDIEVGAEDILKVFGKAQSAVAKAAAAEPKVLAALGVVAAAVSTAVEDTSSAAAAGGLNFSIDAKIVPDIQAVWPDVKAFLGTLGIVIK
jgi:hypothetical protein